MQYNVEPIIREPVVEVSFLTQTLSYNRKRKVTKDFVWEKMIEKIDPFWHSEKDQIEYFFFYNDGTYFCQKRKIKYDFESQSQYWHTYNWSEPTNEQAKALADFFETFAFIQLDVNTREFWGKIEKLQEEQYYFDKKYYKKIVERNAILNASDWRVLPDSPQKFEGEREMWVKWRQYLRGMCTKKPEEFANNLEFFKYVTDIRYPVDPRVYYGMYPNFEVEYMDKDDEKQWVEYDFEASQDFINQNLRNIMAFLENANDAPKRIPEEILNLAKQLELEEVFPGLDLSTYTPISFYDKLAGENEIATQIEEVKNNE